MIKTYLTKLGLFAGYLVREIKNPSILLVAAAVGAAINLLMEGNTFHSLVPYLVPVIIQIISRGSLNYFNRHREKLLELPVERKDPAFIMKPDGTILLSGGKTKNLFAHHHITHLKDFIGRTLAQDVLNEAAKTGEEPQKCRVYSRKTQRWYETKVKCYMAGKETDILVWMNDITPRMILDRGLTNLRRFSSETMSNIHQLVEKENIAEKLAALIIKSGFHAVFITRANDDGNMEGHVYKCKGMRLIDSEEIIIEKTSSAPVLASQKLAAVVAVEAKNFPTRLEFEKKFPFHPKVKDFLDAKIDNFVNYYEGEFSIIAFNKAGGLDEYDDFFIETAVNNVRSIGYLVDLARENDEQFIQKVMGLCAAAEFSDEITGKHIFRVNDYSQLTAKKLGMDNTFVNTIGQVASLHDIGKVAIPELIKLDRRYTDDERAQMQMHTVYGAQIIKTMMSYAAKKDPRLEMAYNLALHHHQTWVGTGYPGLKSNGRVIEPTGKDYRFYRDGTPLKGEEIPKEALITSLADTYDALRGKRQYKPEFSHEKTKELLAMDDRLKISGADRFGPEVWSVFEKYHNQFDHIFNQTH